MLRIPSQVGQSHPFLVSLTSNSLVDLAASLDLPTIPNAVAD
jgi:hypothetical protein